MRKVFRGIGAIGAWLYELNQTVVDFLANRLSWVVALVACALVFLGAAVGGYFARPREAPASRNSSGTMASFNGPYVAGTVISAATLNARFSDIESEITDSASRSGKGGFTAPARTADGTVTAPAFAFTSETGTGLYRIGSSNPGMSVNQSKKQEWTSTGTVITGTASVTSTADVVGDFSVATNKFNVTAASGNTSVAGTLGVTGATTATGGVTIGSSGTAISKSIRGTTAWNPGTLTAQVCAQTTITVTGASAGAECQLGIPNANYDLSRMVTSCTVTANTCNINACNITTSSTAALGSATWACRVWNP